MKRVKKRDGTLQDLDIDKIHSVLEWACNGDGKGLGKIKGVSLSEIEMKAHLHLYDKMKTKDIHECLIRAAADLISEDTPNYDHVTARLRWFAVRKEAYCGFDVPHILEIVKKNTALGLYDTDILGMYTEDEWNAIECMIDHTRDDRFRFAGAEQMHKKYLVQNRKTKQIYESFQIPYILVAAILFSKYPKETRLTYVKRFYDAVSMHLVSLPTPIMAGLRTKIKQFSSCTVIDVGDSLDSIKEGSNAIIDYASNKAGIGLNVGRLRAVGQPVRMGDAVTTGVIPFAKYFAASLKGVSQGAVRGASATFNYPIWHLEFESLIELKNNKGTDETRLRTVDYCVHLNKTMYERLASNGNITFFSPEEVPDLYEAFYGDPDVFKPLYEKYEQDRTKTKKTLPAKEVFAKLVTERFDTGRIYILHADHVNLKSSIYEKIYQTNLCAEITLHTEPLSKENPEEGLIALCTLSAVNLGMITSKEDMLEATEMAVRSLDELLDYQDYMHPAAKRHVDLYRPLGVGVIGFAHWLAKNNLVWGKSSEEAVDKLFHDFSYGLIKTSVELAKEKGPLNLRTKYHDGIMPSNSPEFVALSEEAKKYGIRNSVLAAGMPSETSSQTSNETNGFEPPRGLVTVKGSKDGTMSQVVPDIAKYGFRYQLSWEVPVQDYLFTIGVAARYFDQSISANTSYNPHKQDISTSVLVKDLIFAWKNGVKTLYYNNTLDDAPEQDDGCEGGGCKI